MQYQNIFDRLVKEHKIPPDALEYAKIFFEAGVKTSHGTSTQIPLLLKGKQDDQTLRHSQTCKTT